MIEKPTEMPWHVRTDGGGFHSGYENEDNAHAAATHANAAAEKLGIKARYVVSEKP